MKRKTFKEVDVDLNLTGTNDWGIENSDAIRVKEFILYEKNNLLEKGVKSS